MYTTNAIQLVMKADGLTKKEKMNIFKTMFFDKPINNYRDLKKSTYSKFLSAYFGSNIYKRISSFDILEFITVTLNENGFIKLTLPKSIVLEGLNLKSKDFLKKFLKFISKIYPKFEIYLNSSYANFSQSKLDENKITNIILKDLNDIPYKDIEAYTKTKLSTIFLKNLKNIIHKEILNMGVLFNDSTNLSLQSNFGEYLCTDMNYQFKCKLVTSNTINEKVDIDIQKVLEPSM